jgi:hypothetical protein
MEVGQANGRESQARRHRRVPLDRASSGASHFRKLAVGASRSLLEP